MSRAEREREMRGELRGEMRGAEWGAERGDEGSYGELRGAAASCGEM